MQRQRVAEMSKGVGQPKVGGPLNLIDQNGIARTDEDFRGKYRLVSSPRSGHLEEGGAGALMDVGGVG